MPQIIAWQCAKTGEVFTRKADYMQHLKKLARQRYQKRTAQKFRQQAKDYFRSTLRLASSFQEIEAWFSQPENWKFLANRVSRLGDAWGVKDPNIIPDKFKIKYVHLNKMRWHDCCPNSHAAPDGKPQNWVRNPDLPRGYPGWIGEMTFEYEDAQNLATDIFIDTGIHTQSGSAVHTKNQCLEIASTSGIHTISEMKNQTRGLRGRYGVTLFAEEWPSLLMWEKLK